MTNDEIKALAKQAGGCQWAPENVKEAGSEPTDDQQGDEA